MAQKFSCNSCGAVTDTGYFYCEKCHRIHKQKTKNQNSKEISNNDVLNARPVMSDVPDQKGQAL
jgi:predicted ATP-dependent serine protease